MTDANAPRDAHTRVASARGNTTAVAAVALQNVVGHPLYLYRGRHPFGSFEEVRAVSTTTVATSCVLLFGALTVPGRPLPASVPVTGGALAILGMLVVRYLRRFERERAMRPNATSAKPVLVYGAGAAGIRLVRDMLRNPSGRYLPVGLIDDDPAKRHLRVDGVPVLGNRAALRSAVARTGSSAMVFAIQNAGSTLVQEARQAAESAGLAFKVLRPVSSLLDRAASVSNIRDVDVTDLLGRGQVQTDLPSIAGYLAGKRVLVTGAGGSIGSELCRQVHRFKPAELIMLDRDESALHAVQLSIQGQALLDDPTIVLADLRDEPRIRALMAERRPQVVFHAAALKHQPLLEQYPAEAVKTNVWGTLTVLEAAADQGVEVLVNISTDKAADPCSVLGYSKRATERLTAHVAGRADGRFLSVRFGNVLGSRGSVVTTFAAQIAAGGPVTVTDPRVTRYFMTVEEAVQLVIQAGANGRPGEALVLDIGEPVRITALARQMASLANEQIEIVYTGLRHGEKLRENLFGAGEQDERPSHPLIAHVKVPPLEPALARAIDPSLSDEAVVEQLTAVCAVGVGGAQTRSPLLLPTG